MSVNGVGILAAIIIGGLAGWLAEKFMHSDMGLFMNVLLGIIGAVVLNFILAAFGMAFVGWLHRRLPVDCRWSRRQTIACQAISASVGLQSRMLPGSSPT